jgi:hypothetical protein
VAKFEATANGKVMITFVLEGEEAVKLLAVLRAAGYPIESTDYVPPSPPSENGTHGPGDHAGP